MLRATLLNAIARGALRGLSPTNATRAVTLVGRLLPSVDEERAAAIVRSLEGGTCLSRSLAIAALVPESEVVIGVPPPGQPAWSAHAWVEIRGKALVEGEARGAPIARLPGR